MRRILWLKKALTPPFPKAKKSKLLTKSYLRYTIIIRNHDVFYMDDIMLNDIFGFDWDEPNTSHIAKHHVSREEAEDIFFDNNHILDADLKHSLVEKRYIIVGKTKVGRLLYQIFTIRKKSIRIISSRDINRKEIILYEK
jgi:uncharacterized DUF497 family protein